MYNTIKGLVFMFTVLAILVGLTYVWPSVVSSALNVIAGIQIGTWCWNYTSKKWPPNS